ncbi:MAG TPA: hypothetical protein VF601_19835 [Beijerinckiaceae bacterium]
MADQRARLIDHFKRVYTIVVGLSITEACKRLFPFDFSDALNPSVLMFVTFLVTVVPIFHGGDRSLDVKYLENPPEKDTPWRRFLLMWDVFMLLITAIFFVGIALSMQGAHGIPTPSAFYFWMSRMLFFDCGVLIIDLLKTHLPRKLGHYLIWILLNFALGYMCLRASRSLGTSGSTSDDTTWWGWVIFGLAFLRTIIDYIVGAKFMFPSATPSTDRGSPAIR